MPASQPCPTPGCPELKPCPTHPEPSPWAGSKRKTSPAWAKVRAAALKRDGHRCVICGTPSNIVDHIVNKANGGSDTLSNAQVLCDPCHKAKTATETARGRWG